MAHRILQANPNRSQLREALADPDSRGAATGILNATVQGRALYETLSWTVIGPLNSFVYKRAGTTGQG